MIFPQLTIHTHKFFLHLPTLLEILVSVSGEEPLLVGGFLLQHPDHATKVASLLLFCFVFFFTLHKYTFETVIKSLHFRRHFREIN